MQAYRIIDEYTIQLPDVELGTGPVADDTPYLYFVQHKIGDIAAQTGCFLHLIDNYLADWNWDSVVEYFGGVGIDSTLLYHKLRPTSHVIMDLDEACVEVISQVAPWATVRQGDFYECSGMECDLAVVDYNRFTMLRAIKEGQLRESVVKAVQASSAAIVTDSSIFYLHLNDVHYSRLCGRDIHSPEDYFKAFSEMFREWLGYGIRAVAYHSRAAYMLLDEEWAGPLEECTLIDRQASKCLFRQV